MRLDRASELRGAYPREVANRRRTGPGATPRLVAARSGPYARRDATDAVGWQPRAACVRADPDLFVGDRRGDPAAFAFCAQCPVVTDCAELATRNGESYGVWGGSLRG